MQQQPAKMPPISPPMTLKEFESITPESKVNVAMSVIATPDSHLLDARVLEPDEAEPFNLFHPTSRQVRVAWSPESKIIMGTAMEVGTGALVRVIGKVTDSRLIQAEAIVILTRYARVK